MVSTNSAASSYLCTRRSAPPRCNPVFSQFPSYSSIFRLRKVGPCLPDSPLVAFDLVYLGRVVICQAATELDLLLFGIPDIVFVRMSGLDWA